MASVNLLVVSQYYWPEPFNVSDMCEELVVRGHDVTVLTGLPNYPEGNLYPGYENASSMLEERCGVKILRVPLHPRGKGPVDRFLNYESFSRNASKVAQKLEAGFDAVLAYEVSPVMSASPALVYAEKHGVPSIVYVLDIWPECLLSGGVKRNSLIYRYYKRVSRKIYGAADVLLLSSPGFREYLESLLAECPRCVYLPQYAEDIFSSQVAACGERIEGFADDGIDVTFAGNIGAAQSVDTLIRAFSSLDGAVRLHVVGSGSELESCKALADELRAENVYFHGRHELSEMPLYYHLSDALAISFVDDPVIGLTLPRKMQTYLAAGKPILGAVTGEASRVIRESQCGLRCGSEDAESFAELCRTFAASPSCQRAVWSLNARSYYDEHFTRNHFFDTLESLLVQAIEASGKEK